MTGLPSAPHLPRYAGRVPQLVRYGLAKEIHRCLRVLRFLGGLNARDLIRSRPPRANARLLSVVVPMRNARDWIEPCLKSVLAQTHSDLEIFCVDDCSTDDTYGRVVDQFGRDRRLCVIRLGKNAGPYQIKNWVIHALTRARLVALQDADDVSHPTRLAELKQWMVRHRLSIGGTSVHQFFPPHIEPMVGTVDRVEVNGVRHSLAVYASVSRTRAPILVKEMLWERKVERFMNRHGSMAFYGAQMFARDAFLEFGGFDGHTRVGADKDFNWRLVRFHSIGNLLKVLYSRRIHDLSLTQDPVTGYNSAFAGALRGQAAPEGRTRPSRASGEEHGQGARTVHVGPVLRRHRDPGGPHGVRRRSDRVGRLQWSHSPASLGSGLLAAAAVSRFHGCESRNRGGPRIASPAR